MKSPMSVHNVGPIQSLHSGVGTNFELGGPRCRARGVDMGGLVAQLGRHSDSHPACRGVWGHAPPEKFSKFGAQRCHLRAFPG